MEYIDFSKMRVTHIIVSRFDPETGDLVEDKSDLELQKLLTHFREDDSDE